jgi:hypothetical protein
MSATHDDDGDRAARAEDGDLAACASHARLPRDADGARIPDAARARLAGLQHAAAEAYAAIAAADEALRVAARHRVTSERALRLAAGRHAAASRAVAVHERARPGPFAQLATWFRAGREWRQRQPALEAGLAGAEGQLAVARQALSAAKDDFTARVAGRAAVAATLRRLTAECEAARAQIAALDGSRYAAGNGIAAEAEKGLAGSGFPSEHAGRPGPVRE